MNTMNPDKRSFPAPDADPLKDLSDKEIDAATDTIEHDKRFSDTDGAEVDKIYPDTERTNPLESLSETELDSQIEKVFDAAIERDPDVEPIKTAREAAEEIDRIFNSDLQGKERDAALQAIRDKFLESGNTEGKPVNEIMTIVDVLRSQIVATAESYDAQSAKMKADAENKEAQVASYRELGHDGLAEERKTEAEQLIAASRDLNSKGQERHAFAATALDMEEWLDVIPSDTVERYMDTLNDEEFELKDEVQKAELVNEFTKNIENELKERVAQGEFDDAKVQAIRQNMQKRIEELASRKLEEYQDKVGGPAEGEKKLDIGDDDIDALFG